jgi:hypothetical protein
VGAIGDDPNSEGGGRSTHHRWNLARVGLVLTPLLAIWLLLALVFPSPIGVYVTAIPELAIALFAAAAVLAFGLLRTGDRWSPAMRNTVAMGCVLGLVIAGGAGLVAISQGCPTLTSTSNAEPQSWEKAANSPWTQNGAPVFYFYGAYACPFCSATSWGVFWALSKVGTVSGVQYGHSNPGDIFGNTPEIYVDQLSVQSPYADLLAAENHNPTDAVGPTPGSCTQQAYVSAYDSCSSCGIPFIVLNGQYWHTGTVVPPQNATSGALLSSYSPEQVMGQLQNQSGPAWDDIYPGACWILSFIVKANNGLPLSAASIPQVREDLGQIS